jgi:hypothetical protein
MKGRVLAAGWPFAGLLALDAGRAETPDAAPVHGLIVGNDDQNGSLVLESDDTPGPLATSATTRFYGVDGYPVGRGDIRVGDEVEAVREKIGADWVTTKIRVLRLTPRTSPGSR